MRNIRPQGASFFIDRLKADPADAALPEPYQPLRTSQMTGLMQEASRLCCAQQSVGAPSIMPCHQDICA